MVTCWVGTFFFKEPQKFPGLVESWDVLSHDFSSISPLLEFITSLNLHPLFLITRLLVCNEDPKGRPTGDQTLKRLGAGFRCFCCPNKS